MQKFFTPSAKETLSPPWISSRCWIIRHRLLRPRKTGAGRPAGWPSVSIFTRSPRTSPTNPRAAASCDGVAEFRRFAKIHRAAGVDQGVEMKILLFQVHLQEEFLQAGVGVPIDEPQVVARHVVAEVGELDALALARAAAFAFHPPAKNLPAHKLESFELGQEFGREQGGSIDDAKKKVATPRFARWPLAGGTCRNRQNARRPGRP